MLKLRLVSSPRDSYRYQSRLQPSVPGSNLTDGKNRANEGHRLLVAAAMSFHIREKLETELL